MFKHDNLRKMATMGSDKDLCSQSSKGFLSNFKFLQDIGNPLENLSQLSNIVAFHSFRNDFRTTHFVVRAFRWFFRHEFIHTSFIEHQ